MNLLNLLFVFAVGTPANAVAAQSPELEGTWVGVGQLDEARRPRAIEAKMKVGIFRKDDKLNISECWDTGEGEPDSNGCILSHYDVDENSTILFKGRKVGDLFSGKIQVYIGNSQVSEQLQLDLHGQQDLIYQYNYSNFDGDSSHRKSLLKRVP